MVLSAHIAATAINVGAGFLQVAYSVDSPAMFSLVEYLEREMGNGPRSTCIKGLADFNGDGQIDCHDVCRFNWCCDVAMPNCGDINGDGICDYRDRDIYRANYLKCGGNSNCPCPL